jgi:hypothetical protein
MMFNDVFCDFSILRLFSNRFKPLLIVPLTISMLSLKIVLIMGLYFRLTRENTFLNVHDLLEYN